MENGWLYMSSVYAPVSTTVPKSREAALILREQVDAFLQEDDCVGVMVSGDFNATWYPENVTLRRNMGSSGSTPRGKGREWRAALTGGSVVVNDSLIRPDDEAAVDPSIWATRLGTNNNQSTLIDYGVWFGPAALRLPICSESCFLLPCVIFILCSLWGGRALLRLNGD